MGAKGAGRHMEHTWQHLAGDLIHIRDHQQQPLGGGVSSGQGTGLQGTMDRTGRPTLGLHLHHLYRLAEEVLFTVSRPASTCSAMGEDGVIGKMPATSVKA